MSKININNTAVVVLEASKTRTGRYLAADDRRQPDKVYMHSSVRPSVRSFIPPIQPTAESWRRSAEQCKHLLQSRDIDE
jgi:hypothetical protein